MHKRRTFLRKTIFNSLGLFFYWGNLTFQNISAKLFRSFTVKQGVFVRSRYPQLSAKFSILAWDMVHIPSHATPHLSELSSGIKLDANSTFFFQGIKLDADSFLPARCDKTMSPGFLFVKIFINLSSLASSTYSDNNLFTCYIFI